MNKRNELFKKALDWLYSEGKVADQRELSSATGINEVTISRIVNNKVKEPSEATLRKLDAAFGHIFNMSFFRGENVSMLKEEKELQSSMSIDPSSAINAAIAAHAKLVDNLEYQLRAKEKELRERLIDKDAQIELLQARVFDLERLLKAEKKEEISTYQYPIGTAEESQGKRI